MSSDPDTHTHTREWAFAFADLSGYTALTEAHGDETAADVAERFYEITRSAMKRTSASSRPSATP